MSAILLLGRIMRTAASQLTNTRRPPSLAVLRRPLRWIAVSSVLALAALHGELLLRRLADNSIAEPSVLLRWLGGAGLLAGAHLWRRTTGKSVLTGRSALVFALLVALLHAGVPGTPSTATTIALPGELLVLGLAWVLLTVAGLNSRGGLLRDPRGDLLRDAVRCRAPRSLPYGRGFSPRPPPAS